MLAQTLAAGDKFRTEDLHSLPAGTMVKVLGNSGWWEVAELPQVETVNERDQLARELRNLVFLHGSLDGPPPAAFLRQADYVLANFTPAETGVAEVAADEVVDAQVVDYPERIRDCDGDLWRLSGPGKYSWVGALRDEINFTNVSLTDLLANHGPISAE